MLKDVGLLVNCGRLRLRRRYSKRSSVAVNFVVSVEVFDEESSDAAVELRKAIQETVNSWSRAGLRKMKREERERKHEQHERGQTRHR